MVEHGGQSVRQLGLEEGSLDVLGEVVEHVHRLPGEGEVGPEYMHSAHTREIRLI